MSYSVIGEPPVDVGAVTLTVTFESPAVKVTPALPGTVAGIAL